MVTSPVESVVSIDDTLVAAVAKGCDERRRR